ncbi:MAG: Glycine-tRNA ligase [Candidatus Peregrinibacteria bacterium GW2011_GWA2_47_7]|nr:MAG: Glycine-tRNA ligase [Candidatus Peregrinibacteria bacterium GW2011_GWA2_47_7]
MEQAGTDLNYFDPDTKQKFVPHVIEPTFGLTRSVLMVLLSAYHEDVAKDADGKEEKRIVLRLKKEIAPFRAAVFPLQNKLEAKAMEVWEFIKGVGRIDFDTSGSIGKRYRRHDEIGTPYCITIDFETAETGTVTIRDRDSMVQERVKIEALKERLA